MAFLQNSLNIPSFLLKEISCVFPDVFPGCRRIWHEVSVLPMNSLSL